MTHMILFIHIIILVYKEEDCYASEHYFSLVLDLVQKQLLYFDKLSDIQLPVGDSLKEQSSIQDKQDLERMLLIVKT